MNVIEIASENPEVPEATGGLRCQYWKFQVSPARIELPLELGMPNPGPPEAELEMSVEKPPNPIWPTSMA